MGAISFSIDRTLVETIQGVLHARTFVETGTFEGDSVALVVDLFENILTVERSQTYYEVSSRRFQDQPNVQLTFGESPDFLRQARDQIGTSAIFWLDAHWCLADSTSGEKSQCPLLAELEAIGTLSLSSVVMIDDARLFMAAPPKPHEITHWPTLSQVMGRLTKISTDHSLMILNDVIIFYPPALEETLRKYSHDHSVDWLHIIDESREYKTILEAERAENEQLRPIAAEAETREALLNENDAAQRELREHLEARTQQVANLSAALEDARAGWTSAAEAAAERLELLEAATVANDRLRVIADIVEERDAHIAELSGALDEARAALEVERAAATERLELLERATRENEQLRVGAANAMPSHQDMEERDRQMAQLAAAAADRLELLERATAENERLRALAAEAQAPLIEHLQERDRQIVELHAALETERVAAAERLHLLETATVELQQQIRHATERASIIDSLTDIVEKQQRTIERGGIG